MIAPAPAPTTEKFCPDCGKSRLPLSVPHVTTECVTCGRTIHFVRPGDDGQGIKVEAGERLTIPAGFISISLEPRSNAKLFRPGLLFLIHHLFAGKLPTEATMLEFVNELDEDYEKYIWTLDEAKDVEQSDAGLETLLQRVGKDKQSRNWHILAANLFCAGVKWSVENNNAQRAAWSGYMLGIHRGLSIVTEPIFEETLWLGYLANSTIYEAAAAASHTPGEAEAIKKLKPLFEKQDEATLHAWVESGLPIGPRIGVKALPEELLKALAQIPSGGAQARAAGRARHEARET